MDIWLMDFETTMFDYKTNDDYYLNSRFCCVINYKTNERFFFNIEKYGNNELINFLTTLKKPSRIYFHNLNFDIIFLFHLLSKQYDYQLAMTGSKIIQFLVYRESILKSGRVQKHTIIDIRNSLNLFPTKLEILGKSLGFKKFKQDYSIDVIDDKYIEYCFRDCEIIQKGLEALISENNEIFNMDLTIDKIPLTFTALNKQCLHYLGTSIYGKIYYNLLYDKYSKSYEKDLEPYYFGGRVEVYDFNVMLNGFYNDYVSRYPFEMKSEFPVPPYSSYVCSTQNQCFKEWKENDKIFGVECIINEQINIPLIPSRYKDKILYAKGKKKCFLFRKEYEYLKSFNTEIQILKLWKCSGYFPIFKDYIELIFPIKQKSKGFKRENAKLKLNGMYGKMAEKRIREIIRIINNIRDIPEKDYKFIQIVEKSDDIIYISRKEQENFSLKRNIILAMFITAMARLGLHKDILKYIGSYSDTDSIVSIHNSGKSSELGSLSVEFSFLKFQAFGCKEYCYEYVKTSRFPLIPLPIIKTAYKMKGFGKNLNYNSLEHFKSEYLKGKKQHRIIGFLESFNRKENMNKVLVYDKFKRSYYDKRWINDDLTTRAFDLDNDDINEMIEHNAKIIQERVLK